jgi:hypothetical protein
MHWLGTDSVGTLLLMASLLYHIALYKGNSLLYHIALYKGHSLLYHIALYNDGFFAISHSGVQQAFSCYASLLYHIALYNRHLVAMHLPFDYELAYQTSHLRDVYKLVQSRKQKIS